MGAHGSGGNEGCAKAEMHSLRLKILTVDDNHVGYNDFRRQKE